MYNVIPENISVFSEFSYHTLVSQNPAVPVPSFSNSSGTGSSSSSYHITFSLVIGSEYN